MTQLEFEGLESTHKTKIREAVEKYVNKTNDPKWVTKQKEKENGKKYNNYYKRNTKKTNG
jgi:hypothetical protein